MAENEERRKRKSSRRSSILKLPRSPRSALSDMDQNVESEEDNTVRRKSRRVSFAETYQVKEFMRDNGNGNHGSGGKNQTPDGPSQAPTSSECTGNKVSTAGLATLLTGAIENEMPLSLHKQTSASGSSESVNKIDTKDFLNNLLTGGKQGSASHIKKIDPPIIPERRHSPLKANPSNIVFQSDQTRKPTFCMDNTRIFDNGEDDVMEMTGVLGGVINTEEKSYGNVTWANESTKVFGKSVIEQYENELKSSSGGSTGPSSGLGSNNVTLSGNRTQYFQTEEDEMELTGMNHDVSIMRTKDTSILAGAGDLSMMESMKKVPEDSGKKINSKMFLAGLLSTGSSKKEKVDDNAKVSQDDTVVDRTEKVDTRGFLKGLMGETETSSDDKTAADVNLKNKTTLLSESMDLTTCVSESPESAHRKSQNIGTTDGSMPSSKIDSQDFLLNLMGQSNKPAVAETNQGKVDTHMFLQGLLTNSKAQESVKTGEAEIEKPKTSSGQVEKIDANLFLRNIMEDKNKDFRSPNDTDGKSESSGTFTPDDSLSRSQRKGLSDITHTYSQSEEPEDNHTIYFNKKNTMNSGDEGQLDKTECVGGILNSPTVSNVTKQGNKSVCFNLEHTIHVVEKLVHPEQEHLEELIAEAEAIGKEQNKTVHFADDSCLMEETACTGKLIAQAESRDTEINSQNKTQHFADDSCLMEETACTGKLIAQAEAKRKEQNRTQHFANESCFMEETLCTGKVITPGKSEEILFQGKDINEDLASKNIPIPSNLTSEEKDKLTQTSDGAPLSTMPDSCANKTVVFEECPMEETCMTGVFKQKNINMGNQTAQSEQSDVHCKTKSDSIGESSSIDIKPVQEETAKTEIFDKTKIFSELNKTGGGFAMEETVCVGGLVKYQNEVPTTVMEGSKKVTTSERTIIFSELNKTGAMAMDETMCSGKEPELNLAPQNACNSVFDQLKMGLVTNEVKEHPNENKQMDSHDEASYKQKLANKTVIFDEYPMEETCFTANLLNKIPESNIQSVSDFRIEKNLDNVTLGKIQSEKVSLEKTQIFGELDQTSRDGAIEETACVGGFLKSEEQMMEQVASDIIDFHKGNDTAETKRVVQELLVSDRMEQSVCKVEVKAEYEAQNEGCKQVSGRSDRTVLYGAMNKTAGLLDETSCVGGIITEAAEEKEKNVNIPSKNGQNKTVIFSNMDQTGIGIMDETECIGDVLHNSLPMTYDQISAEGSYPDNSKMNSTGSILENKQTKEQHYPDDEAQASFQSEKDCSYMIDIIENLEYQGSNQSNVANIPDSLQASADTSPAPAGNRLSMLKNRLKRISMGPDTVPTVGAEPENPEVTFSEEREESIEVKVESNDEKEKMAEEMEDIDSIADLPPRKDPPLQEEEELLNKTGGSLNTTSASSLVTRSFMGNLSTLLPKPSRANSLSAASGREEYDMSRLNVESIDDYLRLFHVIFLDKSRRVSTLAPVSVCPAQTVSEALQLVVYEPQIQTYEWTCDQLTNLIDNCQMLTAESEARMLKDVPDILKNEPGHQESVEILGEMKSLCRKKATLNFKQCKAKMLKAISMALKGEIEGLNDGLQEIKEAELQMDTANDYLDQVEAELDAATRSLTSASDVMQEIKDTEEKKGCVELRCRGLESERTQLSVSNERLRECVSEVSRKSEEVNSEMETLRSQSHRDEWAKLNNLRSISAFDVLSWNNNSGIQLGFLEGNLTLNVTFGKALSQTWYGDNPHREVTDICFKSNHEVEETYGSKALQMGINLMMQYYSKQILGKECPDTTCLVQVLKPVSLMAAQVGQLVRDLSSHSLSLVHKTQYDLPNNRLTLKVSSLKAWTKFNLVFSMSKLQFPITTIPWELHSLIGDVRDEAVKDLVDSVQPGNTYMRQFIMTLLNFVNTKTTDKLDSQHE